MESETLKAEYETLKSLANSATNHVWDHVEDCSFCNNPDDNDLCSYAYKLLNDEAIAWEDVEEHPLHTGWE